MYAVWFWDVNYIYNNIDFELKISAYTHIDGYQVNLSQL